MYEFISKKFAFLNFDKIIQVSNPIVGTVGTINQSYQRQTQFKSQEPINFKYQHQIRGQMPSQPIRGAVPGSLVDDNKEKNRIMIPRQANNIITDPNRQAGDVHLHLPMNRGGTMSVDAFICEMPVKVNINRVKELIARLQNALNSNLTQNLVMTEFPTRILYEMSSSLHVVVDRLRELVDTVNIPPNLPAILFGMLFSIVLCYLHYHHFP
jgi:hypothetical protein